MWAVNFQISWAENSVAFAIAIFMCQLIARVFFMPRMSAAIFDDSHPIRNFAPLNAHSVRRPICRV
jgi:hypothetical protein